MQMTITENVIMTLLFIALLPYIHLLLLFVTYFIFDYLFNFVVRLARFIFDITVTFLILYFLLRVYFATKSFDYMGIMLDSYELFYLVE